MSTRIEFITGPLPAAANQAPSEGAGAVLRFEGIVRAWEDGRALRALAYEVYEPMAGEQLAELVRELAGRHGLTAVHVEHSRGEVPVGACSFRLTIQSPHRKEALAAADEFIDRLKRDVAIWKAPIWADGAGVSRD